MPKLETGHQGTPGTRSGPGFWEDVQVCRGDPMEAQAEWRRVGGGAGAQLSHLCFCLSPDYGGGSRVAHVSDSRVLSVPVQEAGHVYKQTQLMWGPRNRQSLGVFLSRLPDGGRICKELMLAE